MIMTDNEDFEPYPLDLSDLSVKSTNPQTQTEVHSDESVLEGPSGSIQELNLSVHDDLPPPGSEVVAEGNVQDELITENTYRVKVTKKL